MAPDDDAPTVTVPAARSAVDVDAAKLTLALEIAQIGSYDWDVARDTMSWSHQLIRMWGEDPETFVPTYDDFLARLHPDDRETTAEAVRASLATGHPFEREYRFVRPDGQVRRWLSRGRPLLSDDGTPLALVGMVVDVTQARSTDERIARTLESITDAFFALDTEWRFTYVNAEAERVLFRARGELLGRSVWECFPEAIGSTFERAYRTAAATGEPSRFEEFFEPLNGIFEVRVYPSDDGLSVYFHDVTGNRRMQAELAALAEVNERALKEAEEARDRQTFLGAASTLIAASLDREEVLRRVTALAVPRLADWASVYLVDGLLLRRVAVAHRDPSLAALAASLVDRLPVTLDSRAVAAEVARTGRPALLTSLEDIKEQARMPGDEFAAIAQRLGIGSAMAVPLSARGRVLGVMSFSGGPDRAPYTDDDLDLATALGTRASVAVLNAELFEREHGLAVALQRAILPPRTPGLPSLDIGVHYLPASAGVEVGGDWYDSLPLPDGRVGVVVGDVAGHGLQAAATMGQLRNSLRAFAFDGDDPDVVVRRLNRLITVTDPEAIATLVYAIFDPATTTLTWCNAGHMPPLLRTSSGLRFLAEVGGPPIGADPDATYRCGRDRLEPADVLVLYTDGLVEDRTRDITAGLDELSAAVARLEGEDVTTMAAEVARLAMGTRRRDDDVCVLVARTR